MNKIFLVTYAIPGDRTVLVGITHDGERKTVQVDRAAFLLWLDKTSRLDHDDFEADYFETPTGRYTADGYFADCPAYRQVHHLYEFIVIHHEEFAPFLNDITA